MENRPQLDPQTDETVIQQIGNSGKSLVQVGHDYIQYLQFNVASSNWGTLVVNAGALGLLGYGLINGAWMGTQKVLSQPDIKANNTCEPLDQRFQSIDTTLSRMGQRFDQMDQQLQNLNATLSPMGQRFDQMDQQLQDLTLTVSSMKLDAEPLGREPFPGQSAP